MGPLIFSACATGSETEQRERSGCFKEDGGTRENVSMVITCPSDRQCNSARIKIADLHHVPDVLARIDRKMIEMHRFCVSGTFAEV